MSKTHLLLFSLAVLAAFGVVVSGRGSGGSTVIRVLDRSGAPYAGVVVLVNPGWQGDSVALVTGRSGTATLPKLDCKVCVVTAIDPRRMFLDKTTEFEGGTPSVTLALRRRPVIDVVLDPKAVKVDVQVNAPDGRALADRPVVLRKKVGTIKDNAFSVVNTDRKGQISFNLRPGDYVLASLVNGRFLEAPLNLAPAVRRKCSDVESDCYIANVARNPLPAHLAVRLAPPGSLP
jgi:hypothetical protein